MNEVSTQRGRPRDPGLDKTILAATRSALVELGFRGTSIEEIARRAGVGKTTVYRRWPDLLQLVFAATTKVPSPRDMGGGMEAQLQELIRNVAEDLERPEFKAALPGVLEVILAQPHRLHELLIGPELEVVESTLGKAQNEQTVRKDLDAELLLDLYVGPLLMRLLRGKPLDANMQNRLARLIMRAIGNQP